jgi:hypothetical protein
VLRHSEQLDLFFQRRLQKVSVTMLLRFVAMTQERHGPFTGQVLKQAQSELLSVVLYSFVPPIDFAGLVKFLQITAAILRPANLAAKNGVTQLLAWTEVCHPDIEALPRKTPPAASRCQNAQTILRFDSSVNGLGFEHGSQEAFSLEPKL